MGDPGIPWHVAKWGRTDIDWCGLGTTRPSRTTLPRFTARGILANSQGLTLFCDRMNPLERQESFPSCRSAAASAVHFSSH